MNQRKPEYAIDPLFVNRWSPRALSTELMEEKDLMKLFEAARWAPSSYNAQQWRFIYAKRGTKEWETLFHLLVPFNQSWAKNAAYLVVILSRKRFEYNDEPSRTHSFDAGAAWQNLALQATLLGLVAHGMEGFDYERTRKELNVPEKYDIEAMIAIGKPGKKEDLPPELQEREFPSDRKKISEFIYEGTFKE